MEESQKEPEKTENQKEEPEKTENQKEEPEKTENKNEEPEKTENKIEEPDKTENKNEEAEKTENKNEEAEKNENKNEENANKPEEKEDTEKPKEGARKILSMKKSIEEVLRRVVKAKKMFKFIKRRIPGKIDAEKRLLNMRQDSIKPKKELEENDFENLNIINRTASVAERIFKIEVNIKKLEEEKKMIEEERRKREERRKNREAERKKREEERKKKEEEEKRKKEEEERLKREEEEKKKKEEEERKLEEERKKKEEEERKIKEEEERIQREIEQIKDEEEKKKREEEEKKRLEEEERKKKEEEERRIKEEEERKRKEEEERKRKEEEERKRIEEEERKKKEEEERKKKEEKKGVEKIKDIFLKKLNKKEEELNWQEKISLGQVIAYEKSVEEYNNSTFREASENAEGRDIKYKFEEVKQITNEPITNIEISKSGKIIALSNKELSKITIYTEKTFEEEDCIVLESKVNSIAIVNNSIYCALEEPEENILTISLDNKDDQVYLVGHSCPVTDLTMTKYGYLVSSDVEGNVFVWKDDIIKKTGNCFHSCINTITETKENTQGIAILNFKEEVIKFYDLRYSTLECLETITNIKGSGRKNNMLRLNENILAVAGTFIYIIDLNSLIVTNMINCLYANESISTFHFNNKGYFFVSQALNHAWTDEYEKGILGYYQYNFKDPLYPDNNTLTKLASMPNGHDDFITAIKQVDSETIATGGLDGKIKFWNLKDIK